MANEPARREIAALRKAADPALASAVAEASLRVAAAHAAEGNRPEAAAIYEQLLSPSQARQVRRGALAALLRLDTDGGEKRIEQIIRGKDVALKPLAIAGISALDAKIARPGAAGTSLVDRSAGRPARPGGAQSHPRQPDRQPRDGAPGGHPGDWGN
jgi:hypothetical protein